MIQDIGPHIFDNSFSRKEAEKSSRIIFFDNKTVLVKKEGEGYAYPAFADLEDSNEELLENGGRYLFAVDGIGYYLVYDLDIPTGGKFTMIDIHSFRNNHCGLFDYIGITAWQLYTWYKSRHFCGRCGKPLVHSEKERMVYCLSCKQMEYPKICPGVIVGIYKEDRLLMSVYAGRGKSSSHYALIAGFTEIGETVEDTVHREAMEEVGLRVKNLTFYKSQPWSFSDSLLMGFFAELDGDDTITLEEDELAMAAWFHRDEIEVEPNNLSLTNEMMMYFKNHDVAKEFGKDE